MCRRWVASARVEQVAGHERAHSDAARSCGRPAKRKYCGQVGEPGQSGQEPQTQGENDHDAGNRQHASAPAGADFWAARASPPSARSSAACMPLSGDGGGIPAAQAQAGGAGRARRTEGAAIPEIPRQERQAGGARRKAAGGRDAGKPARRRHHADREILYPQQRADARRDQRIPTPGRSPSTARSTTSSRSRSAS